MAAITLITGGARSGKSLYAQELALQHAAPRVFIATALAIDSEMELRISNHREERAGQFATVEEPYNLAAALTRIPKGTSVALIDCLTVWLGNLMYRFGNDRAAVTGAIDAFIDKLPYPPCNLIVVTNEVGMGIVPDNAPAREFRDLAGNLNRRVAQRADKVYLCVCGIPVGVK
jgi:adenosylcobinamide kinase/adenosylcobinamide-phosphate guanylyltransferase